MIRLPRRALLALLPLLATAQAAAQSAPPPPSQDKWGITVTGSHANGSGKPIQMSDWRVAETEHVLVYGKEEERVTQLAHNLEKEHFLLSILFNRVDVPDDTIKLRVVLIGDSADFDSMKLGNLRWQQGPYPRAFPEQLYYDPRDDGAVLATTHTDQRIILQQSSGKPSKKDHDPDAIGNNLGPTLTMSTPNAPTDPSGFDRTLFTTNEIAFTMPAEGRVYASYARHYLQTYFPAAYPRWYLDGFGEIFATMTAKDDGKVEYGAAPEGYLQLLNFYSSNGYPIRHLLDGAYLHPDRTLPHWTPYHAWALVHLLFFSEEWKKPLHNYLAAVARGADPQQAAAALGDISKLQHELAGYRGRKVPFERMTYPPDRAQPPVVRKLTENEAIILRGRLELGARVDLPPPPPPGADPDTIATMNQARHDAIARRDDWLRDMRASAAKYPGELAQQLLLTEAECRTGNHAECLAAADRALALSPENPSALTWKGIAMVQLAITGPATDRPARLAEARAVIVRANRADTEAPLPLIAYYRSYADAGEPAPDIAVLGLIKASETVPSAPSIRLMLGEELARRGDAGDAAKALRPVADGAYDSPEKAQAIAVLASLTH